MSTLKNAIALLFLLSLISGSAIAQKARTGTDKTQAVLTIRVNVATVITAPNQGAQVQSQPVSFSIPVAPVRYSVTEAIREEITNGKSEHVLVKTVVAE
jgi:hypothetical protein